MHHAGWTFKSRDYGLLYQLFSTGVGTAAGIRQSTETRRRASVPSTGVGSTGTFQRGRKKV
jgi:hypothetical protein